jgi:predicted transcriptional regulator
MKAIQKLLDSGLTRKQIALTIGVTSHAVAMYEDGRRFPGALPFMGLVKLAEERGILLTCRDFFIDRAAKPGTET